MSSIIEDTGGALQVSDPGGTDRRSPRDELRARAEEKRPGAHDPTVRWLWYAVGFAALGCWLQECAAPWLMAELSADVRLVAAVQAVMTFAICVALVPAAAATDFVDRRRLVGGTHLVLALIAVCLGVLTLAEVLGPGLLLVFTAGMGLGHGVAMAGWPALGAAAAAHQAAPLAGAAHGAGRTAGGAGAAVGGVLIGTVGVAAAFFANAVAFLAVSLSLSRVPAGRAARPFTVGALVHSVRDGVVSVALTPTVRNTMVRAAAFAVGAAALWSLLVVYVRDELGLGVVAFGFLQGAVALGGVTGVLIVRRIRRRLPAGPIGSVLAVFWAACLTTLTQIPEPLVATLCLFGCGVSWFAAVVLYELVALTAVPPHLRARSFGLTLAVLYLATAAGCAVWGHVAAAAGLRLTLSLAAAATAVGAGATLWLRIGVLPRRR